MTKNFFYITQLKTFDFHDLIIYHHYFCCICVCAGFVIGNCAVQPAR